MSREVGGNLERLLIDMPAFNVQSYLDRINSGLARTTFVREGRRWTAAEWITEMGRRFRIKPEWLLTTLQSEQSLVKDPTTYPADYEIIGYAVAPPADYRPPPATQVAERFVKDKAGRWIKVRGVWKMLAAAGAGIPDPGGAHPPWDMRRYLGFDNQVYHAARIAARDLDRFANAVQSEDIAARSVLLYPTREEREKAAAEGRKPVGETVVAGDAATYAMLRYTPSEAVLTARPAVYRSLFGDTA